MKPSGQGRAHTDQKKLVLTRVGISKGNWMESTDGKYVISDDCCRMESLLLVQWQLLI